MATYLLAVLWDRRLFSEHCRKEKIIDFIFHALTLKTQPLHPVTGSGQTCGSLKRIRIACSVCKDLNIGAFREWWGSFWWTGMIVQISVGEKLKIWKSSFLAFIAEAHGRCALIWHSIDNSSRGRFHKLSHTDGPVWNEIDIKAGLSVGHGCLLIDKSQHIEPVRSDTQPVLCDVTE